MASTQEQLERPERRLASIAELRQLALEDLPVDELLTRVAEAAHEHLAGDTSTLLELIPGGERLLVRAVTGDAPVSPLGATPSTAPNTAAGYVLRADGPIVGDDMDNDPRFDPSPVLQAAGVKSTLAVRIGSAERPFGILGCHSRRPAYFDPRDGWFLQALADTVAAAVERARAEAVVRDSEARFRELADRAPVMIWTTDARGDVTFINKGWLQSTGTTLEEELGDTWTFGVHPEDADGLLASWRTALATRSPWEREYRLRQQDGSYRWIVDRGVPRFVDGSFAGYVGTATDIHERKQMEERLRRVYEREHRIAETLQRSLLPERLPRIEGLGLAARYLPAGQESGLGGDWYDALELPDGRVALVVGDVVGHGLRAAAVMGQLRNALRAYALVEATPAEMVSRLGRLLNAGGEEATATILFALLDRDRGEISFTSAGHPPPLLLDAAGARFLEGGRSVPVGATESAVFSEGRATLSPGSRLLLYTDGLVERRDEGLGDRLRRLERIARGATDGDLERLCDQVVAGMLGGEEPLDDVALLAVLVPRVEPGVLSATVPADPEAIAGLRRRLGRFLQSAGATESERYEITLAVAEAAINAVEHAYGPGDARFEVTAELEGRTVVASVVDRGSWREPRGDHSGRGLTIIDALVDEVEVHHGSEGTAVTMRRTLESPRQG